MSGVKGEDRVRKPRGCNPWAWSERPCKHSNHRFTEGNTTMHHTQRILAGVVVLLALLVLLIRQPEVHAYVEAPHSLGQVINLSSNVVLMRVSAVDKTKNAIIYTKVRDIKGVHKQQEIRHNIGKAGFEPREWQ